jgi:hypothetical protein
VCGGRDLPGRARGEERVAHEERPDTCLRARAGMRAGGAGVAACVRRQQRGLQAAVVARLPVSRDSSSEPESAAEADDPAA